MTEVTHPLILDLLAWVAAEPRSYDEVMEAWRSSCPRLTIWEDALEAGYLACERSGGRGTIVRVTARGDALLRAEGRAIRGSGASAAA